ncbi:MAG: TatD family hydrolase [Candidatus Omnitrophota bacterium]
MLIDSHCHLYTLSDKLRSAIFSGLISNDLLIVDSSIDIVTAKAACSFADNNANVYWQAGFHPFSVPKFTNDIMNIYSNLIDTSKSVIGVGEIGLDETADIDMREQERVLRTFIELAKNKSLPITIHNRYENYRILDILNDHYDDYRSVVFHCFSHDTSFLNKILERNGTVSFSLNILRNKKHITESLILCPLENILLETDSPYMRIDRTPSSPLDIIKVYDYVSAAKEITPDILAGTVLGNFKRIFRIGI